MKAKNIQTHRATTGNTPSLFMEGSIVAYISLVAVSVVMQFYLLVAIPDILCTMFDLSTVQALNLTAMFGFSYAAGLLIWGRLAFVYTPKVVILTGLGLLCGVSIGVALTTQYTVLVGLRSVQGFVAGAFPPAAILWLTENISAPRRVAAIACVSCGFLLSASLGQWFGTALISTSLVTAMGITAAIYGAGAILFVFVPSVVSKQRLQPQPFFRDLIQIGRQRDLLKVYVLTFFLFNSLIAFYSGMSGEFHQVLLEHGMNPTWFRVVAIPGLMLSLLTPPCITRFGSLPMVWFSTVLLATGHTLQLLASIMPGAWAYAAHAVYAMGIGFAAPSLISFIGFFAPPQLKGTAMSLYMFILFFGGGAGSFFISYTGAIPMMTVQVCAFIFIAFWFGTDLAKRHKQALPLAVLVVSIMPLLSASTAFAAPNPIITENALAYYKKLSPKEQEQYTYLWVASGKKVSGKVKTQDVTLYRWQRVPDLALGQDNVSIQVTDKGELSGFARYIPSAAAEPLPSKEAAEKTAREFLQTYAPDLLPVMNIQWINPHRDETYTDGNTTYRINGMKMKCRSTAEGTYFWVVVGSDNTVIVFERDIEWDFIRSGRQSEKWLHDDWLQKNNIKFNKE